MANLDEMPQYGKSCITFKMTLQEVGTFGLKCKTPPKRFRSSKNCKDAMSFNPIDGYLSYNCTSWLAKISNTFANVDTPLL